MRRPFNNDRAFGRFCWSVYTFDTDTFDKVSRPALYSKDQGHPEMVEVHDALKTRDIQGFICDVALTLEGIRVDDRSTAFGGTVARSSIAQVSEDTFSITVTPEQADRRACPSQASRTVYSGV